jgi:hypothetical protein
MANYLHAHPGFPQKIGNKMFTIKWMYSEESDAKKRVTKTRKEGKWEEVRLYPRKVNGKLFGKHPWCVAVREALWRKK